MGIDVEQWRAKIGLWHAFTTGRPLVSRRRCKPFRGISVRRHECKRAFKARQKRRQKTPVRCQFLPFVVVLTLFVVVDSRINTFNNLSCRLTSSRFYPAIRLAATLFLVGSNKYGSMDKRRNAGVEPRSLISQHSVMTVLAMLLILAGDVEVNPGPSKLEASTDLAFLCSLPLGAEWRNLGTRLLVPEHQLNTIQAIHAHLPNHLQDCLNSMFTFWLNNCAEPTCEFLIQAVDAVGRRDVVTMLCLKYYGFVPPTGTSQSGGQFPYQASAHCLPPQQPDTGYQATLAQSQPLQQGMHGFEHGVQFPQPQQQYHANPQQQQPYLSLPSGQLIGGLSKPTKPQLMKELFSTVASEWHHIGTYLEISDGELNTIGEREHGNPTKSLMAMLTVWLQRVSPPASWSDIADAVEVIGRPDIAQQIRQKYCMHVFQQGAQLLQHQQQPQHIQAPNMHPAGQEQLQQLYQHGIHQAPLSHQQPWYLQPQHGVQEPPPGQQRSGYHQPQYDVQHPPPGQQQPAYPQIPNAVQQSHPNQQQLSHPHPQHIAQHPLTGQKQQHTNTQLSSGQFTTEHQATNLGSLPGTSFSGAPNQTSGFPSREEDTPVHISDINSSSQELLSGLQHECSISSNANGASTESSNVLSRHPPFLHLSASEQEELRAMLDDDVREMKRQFGFLVTKTRDSVEERIPVGKYATSILALGAYEPVPEERNQSLLNEHREEIKMAKSTSEIFNVLSAYWNYLNYEILEDTIELYGTSEDKKRLERYNEHLQRFCERRIFELSLPESSSSSSGNTLSSKQKKLAVKLNVCEDIKCNELLRIRSRIAKILHVKLAALIIDGVDAGCVQLTLLIPTFVAQEIFPLSNEQMSALHKDASVIRLECGDYVFENASETSTEDHFTMSLAQEGRKDNAASTDQELSEAADVTDKIDCVYEEDTEECTLELELAQQKEISHFKADMEPEGGTEPTDSSDEGDLREASGGYDCTFVEPLPSAFQTECPVCRLLLRDPYQATCCGTNFCQSCIHRVKSKNKLCPTCRKDNFEVFPNKGLKRSIYQLRVFCVHRKDASCPWKGDVWELENHLKEVDHTAAKSYAAKVDSTLLAAQSSAEVQDGSKVDSTPLAGQSFAGVTDGSKVNSTPLAAQSSADATEGSKVNSTALDNCKPDSTSGIQVRMPSDPEENSRSIRCHYANILRGKYQSRVPSVLTLQWPPPPTLKVFNLAMISQRVLRYAPDDEMVRLLQKGNVSDVVSSRNQVTLDEISRNLHSGSRKVILIEGAPGAGKSTLAWHLCTMWKSRQLFREFEIVLFVQLREPTIQSAKSLEDLFPAESLSKKKLKEVISAIQYCGGHQVLIVLDSWDEFPSGLRKDTVIKNLICDPSVLSLQYSALIITSRPVATAQLQRVITTRVEIAGFLRSEIKRYFTEAIGNPEMVQKLTDHLKERPVIEASCYLPLNTAIVAHLFLALNHTLPTTLHGVFTSLVTNCIKRHLEKQAEGEEIPEHTSRIIAFLRKHLRRQVEEREGVPEFGIPPGIQKQFSNLCALAYHGVMENKATFTAADLRSFKLPTKLSTLSLIQAVASFSAHRECKLYNFLHLSTQELLAAFYICKMKPAKQVEIFKQLFEQPRFANVFQFYAAFTKLQTQGIRDTVSSMVMRSNTTLILSLLQCLYEAQDDALCQFVGSELKKELNLSQQTLSPVDCLSVGYFVGSVCSTTTEQFKLTLMINTLDEYGVTLLVREFAKYCISSATQAAAAVETENLYLQLVGEESRSSFEERAIVISKLGQYVRTLNLWDNQIGTAGGESLGTALKECTKLESLNLRSNKIGLEGAIVVMEKMVHVQELDLSFNEMGDEGVQMAMEKMVQFQELDGDEREAGRVKPAMKKLELYGCGIGDGGMKLLSKYMEKMLNLKELNLGANKIGPEGVQHLVTVLEKMVQLKKLSLFHSLQYGTKAGEDLGNKPTVAHIAYVRLCPIHNLYDNNIGNAGAESLGTALKKCTKLKYLNLGGNELNDGGVDAISTSLTKLVHLRKLYLQVNRISDSTIRTLCVVIKSMKCLSTLDLHGNQFTREGEAQLRKAREERDPDCVKLEKLLI